MDKHNTETQSLLDVNIDAIVTEGHEKQKSRKKLIAIIAIISAVIVVVAILISVFSASSDPIVGTWYSFLYGSSVDKSSTITMKPSGSFIYYNADSNYTSRGKWKLEEAPIDTLRSYSISFDKGSSTTAMFLATDEGKEYLIIEVGDSNYWSFER